MFTHTHIVVFISVGQGQYINREKVKGYVNLPQIIIIFISAVNQCKCVCVHVNRKVKGKKYN